MPEDPNRSHSLDTALRGLAERRRAELGDHAPELPGHVREILRREVVSAFRNTGAQKTEGWWSKFFRWQMAVATLGSTALLIGIFGWSSGLVKPAAKTRPETAGTAAVAGKKESVLAEADDYKKNRQVPAPAPLVAPAESPRDEMAARPVLPAVSEERARRGADREVPADPAAAMGGGLAMVPPPASAPASGAPTGRVEGGSSVAPPQPVTKALADAPAPPSPPQQQQRAFGQVAQSKLRGARKDAVTEANVLNEFTLQQDGSQIVVVDADGSEYRGEIVGGAPALDQRAANAVVKRAQKEDKDASGEDAFAFRATGVNRTLKQVVTFEGSFEPSNVATNSQTATDALAAKSAPAPPTKPQAPPPPPVAAATGVAREKAAARVEMKAKAPDQEKFAEQQSQQRSRVKGRVVIQGRDYPVDAESLDATGR